MDWEEEAERRHVDVTKAMESGKLPLTNKKHEAYCQARARGATQHEAYASAGYKAIGDLNSLKVRAHNVDKRKDVRARMAFLQNVFYYKSSKEPTDAEIEELAEASTLTEDITFNWVMIELRKNMHAAREMGKIKDANDSLRMICELRDFFPVAKRQASDALMAAQRKVQDENRKSVAVQIVNQVTGGMGEPTRLESEARDVFVIPAPDDVDEVDEYDGAGGTMAGSDGDEGEV